MNILLDWRNVWHNAIWSHFLLEALIGLSLGFTHENMAADIVLLRVLLLDGVELVGRVVTRAQGFVVLDGPFVAESVFYSFFEHPGFYVFFQLYGRRGVDSGGFWDEFYQFVHCWIWYNLYVWQVFLLCRGRTNCFRHDISWVLLFHFGFRIDLVLE